MIVQTSYLKKFQQQRYSEVVDKAPFVSFADENEKYFRDEIM